MRGKFEWQEGYGAFAYGRSQIQNVINYIQNQEIHHKAIPLKMEYENLLKENEIDYNEKYIFQEMI